jgi:hypothetical protein
MRFSATLITKDLIVQDNLTDDEYKKIVEIFGRELSCIGMDS